jgi:hypothetical protein
MMKRGLLFISVLAVIVSCTSKEPAKTTQSSITKVILPQPFRFQKSIEVKPGLTYDILSWGRGAEQIGQYLILRSDSTDAKYSTISEELEGQVADAWNMDLDSDGNPEIFIQSKGKEKGSYFTLYVHEFSENGLSQIIKFPELTSSTKKKYRGKDSVYVKEGNLFREFPLFDESDTAGLKPIEKKVLEYTLRGNRFDIKEIKEEKK